LPPHIVQSLKPGGSPIGQRDRKAGGLVAVLCVFVVNLFCAFVWIDYRLLCRYYKLLFAYIQQ